MRRLALLLIWLLALPALAGAQTIRATRVDLRPNQLTGVYDLQILYGSADPEGSVTAKPGSLYLRTNGSVYRKGSGTGNTGWVEITGGGTPGGSNTQVQFNDSSAFGGDAGLTYNKTTDTLTAVNLTVSGTCTGCGAGNWTLISTQTLGSPAASISFTSISGSYTHLRMSCNGRTNDSATTAGVALRFNNDSAGNYDRQDFWAVQTGSSITNAFAQTFGRAGIWAGNTAPANYSGMSDIYIPNYAATNFTKAAIVTFAANAGTSGNGTLTGMHLAHWRSTSAITRVDIMVESGSNLLTGSTCSLYGIG